MNIKETAWKGVDWINVVRDWQNWRAVVSTVKNIRAFNKMLRTSRPVGVLKNDLAPWGS
jgi:hypothetical protein